MDYQQMPVASLSALTPVPSPHLQVSHQHLGLAHHAPGPGNAHPNIMVHNPQAPPPPLQVQLHEGDSRWTQYQQIWRQHHHNLIVNNGKSCSTNSTGSSKDCDSHSSGSTKDKDDGELWCNVEAQAAFLGPNLWDKTLPYDADLKVQQYVDLDEFLSENGIPVDGLAGMHGAGIAGVGLGGPGGLGGHRSEALGHPLGHSLTSQLAKMERSPSPSECMSPDTMNPTSPADSTFSMASSGRDFDPRTRAFSDEELKPQPMIKKSRKQFVPDDLKDDKYWARRRKNNMAAKRSRDARRMKENQIALRAGYLEKENMGLRQEMERLKKENMVLRDKLSKFTDL